MDFIIGGVAGAGATLFTNPMDVVKTRMQLQGELRARHEHRARYRNILHALYVIARNDGIMALQSGLAPAMLLGFTMNSVRLGLFHIVENKGWVKNKDGAFDIKRAMLWSSIGGAIGGAVSNPALIVKTRIQAAAHPSIAVGRQHSYKGMLDGCVQIYKAEGIKGFFSGVYATGIRLAVGSGAQLSSYSAAKEVLKRRGICENSPFWLAFTASCISGVVVAVTVCPLDVIVVRLCNQGSASGDGPVYSSLLDCLVKTYKAEGIHGFYKGLGPLYFRIAPHTTLSLTIWDMLNNLLVT